MWGYMKDVPNLKRNTGRPRLRRLDDIVNDLRNMGISQWRKKTEARQERTGIVREAKVKIKVPYNQKRRRRRNRSADEHESCSGCRQERSR
jgi:hypothetical protein